MAKRVAIIGAGYGGLATANLLAKAGYKVDIYEKNGHFGGRAGYKKIKGFGFDTGPSWYLMPEVFEDYYKIFNLSAKKELDIIRLKPGYRVFFESGDPITIYGDVSKDKETFEAIEKGSAKKFEKYVKESTDIYNLAIKKFLYTNFQKLGEVLSLDVLRYGPKMLGYAFNSIDSHVSKRFKDSRLKKILQYHTVFLGSSPFETPAIYSLMSSLDFVSGVYYPKRGIYSMVESLVSIGKSLGVTYHLNSPVEKILVSQGTASGLLLEGGRRVEADVVISNADIHFTETSLVEKKYQTYPKEYWEKRQPGPSALLISLGIKTKFPNLLHHNLYFVDDWKENFESIYRDKKVPISASLYICNPSKTDPSIAPPDSENIFILVPMPAGVSLDKEEIETLVDKFINKLGDITDQPDISKKIVAKYVYSPDQFSEDFNSWLNGALGGQSHKLLQSAVFRTPNKSKKVDNLYYVGAGTTPGIGLPMCLISAQLVYKRVMGIKTAGPVHFIEGKEA